MKNSYQIIISSFFIVFNIWTSPRVTLYLYPYPHSKTEASKTVNSLKKPGKIAKKMLRGAQMENSVSGIFALYFGYLQVSSSSGQISFPRKRSASELNLLITNRIEPLLMHTNTVNHWELSPGAAAAQYSFVLTEDEKTNTTFWQVTEVALPQNDYISSQDTIIIIAKPSNFYVPSGITITHKDPNLVLPPIYVKKGVNYSRNALYALNFAQFFKPSELLYKRGKERYNTLVRE